ncbi:D-alanyl-D-alanine carboxypeptidase DacA precursor [Oxobacter pfennigii]|uniref:serine-type D-Ala-D-Ala carboxypeptidase n=1 Tax=Oxobacter pfennigii TaxID=36849 RepID=A0A0P8YF33_9CLOT|nr:D-alanyl-D-alanine carboxypeptidase family protein [Oxobacter pfennigii]KPU45757.1 D-alanyl-D-alanine carboxypeptidase DacA precursor [Oxobacter pfennigii]
MKGLLKKSIMYMLVSLFLLTAVLPHEALAAPANTLGLKAESAILVDADTGRILYQYKQDAPLHPASMTKMMTEYLLFEAIKENKISWDQETSISDFVYQISQNRALSNVPLRKDQKYTVRELYESMAIYSANGSTIALAELIAGSETNFVKMMNEKGAEMGLTDFKFVNSTGLNNEDLLGQHPEGTDGNEENVMSAKATATLAYHLLKDYPEVLNTSSIPVKKFREGTTDEIQMDNWNWMIPGTMYGVYDYPGVDGLKTGSTDLGGNSFTATAKKNDMRIIAVIMKTSSKLERFAETKRLLDYAFNNFEKKELFPAGYSIEGNSTLPVVKGKEKNVGVVTRDPFTMIIKKGEEDQFEPSYDLDPAVLKDGSLTAPLEKDQVMGSIALTYKGEEDYGYLTEAIRIMNEPVIVTASEVKKANWLVLLFRAIGEFFSGLLKSNK